MSETDSVAVSDLWIPAALASVVGGAVMSAMMVVTPMKAALEMAIPAMYGLSGLPAGVGIHLVHGAVFGLGLAVLLGVTGQGRRADRLLDSVGIGLGVGVVTWVGGAVLLMPVWLSAVGFAGAPPLPNVTPMSLVAHLLYGAVLGAALPALRRVFATGASPDPAASRAD